MGSKAVNVPTNTKIKEQDVNAKLQLYGIYAAFALGKVPSVSHLLARNGISQRFLTDLVIE